MPKIPPPKPKMFADYKADANNWITLATGEYYPDILKDACELYKPVLVIFSQLLKRSESSTRLFLQIAEQSDGWMRVQLARVFRKYDSDRGGAQEDDRTGGYKNCADEIIGYTKKHRLRTKVIFINDGPGLLLGSMWNDYAALESSHRGRIMVTTLRMVPDRLSNEWLMS